MASSTCPVIASQGESGPSVVELKAYVAVGLKETMLIKERQDQLLS
jgi:hypothetical protein